MTRFLTLTAVLLPFLEIPGFILVSAWIGVVPMLLLVLGGVVAGILVLQRVGINAVVSLRLAMAKGEEPGHTLINAACFALGGFLLTIPGFISDLIALVLFLPWTRDYLLRRMTRHFVTRGYVSPGFGPGFAPGGQQRPSGTVLEGEYSVVEDEQDIPADAGGAETSDAASPQGDSGGAESLPVKRQSGNGA
jgi:UPF0716 protein FxsA